MKRAIFLTLLVLFQLVNYCVTFPLEVIDEDEDSPQIVVPRSPSIDGEQTVYLKYSVGNPLKSLTCLVRGTPTPKVIWIRDNNGIMPPLEFNFDNEQDAAVLKFPGQTEETKRDVGNISSTTPKPSSNSSEVATLKDTASGSNSLDTNSTWDGNYTCVAANFLGRVAKTYIVSFDPSIDIFADEEEPEAETTTAISDVEEMTTVSDGLVLQELTGESNDANQPQITTTEPNTDAPTETTTLKSDVESAAKPAPGLPDAIDAKQETISTTTPPTSTASSTTVSANFTEIISTSSSPPIVYVFAKTTSPGSNEYLLGSPSPNVGRRFTRYSNRRSYSNKNRHVSSR